MKRGEGRKRRKKRKRIKKPEVGFYILPRRRGKGEDGVSDDYRIWFLPFLVFVVVVVVLITNSSSSSSNIIIIIIGWSILSPC